MATPLPRPAPGAVARAIRAADPGTGTGPVLYVVTVTPAAGTHALAWPIESDTWARRGIQGTLLDLAAEVTGGVTEEMFADVAAYAVILPALAVAYAIDRDGKRQGVILDRAPWPPFDPAAQFAAYTGLDALLAASPR